jgi:molecular chaperone GrpE
MKQQKNNQQSDSVNDQSSLNEELKKRTQEVEEFKSKYMRALADYQNLDKRTQLEKEEVRKYAARHTLLKFLSPIDGLERATKHIQDEGLMLALKEFYAALTESGVKKIEVIGKSFDPFTMECIEVGEGEEDTVIEEIVSGYMFNDKILRVAQVKVGKKKQ